MRRNKMNKHDRRKAREMKMGRSDIDWNSLIEHHDDGSHADNGPNMYEDPDYSQYDEDHPYIPPAYRDYEDRS